MTIRALSASQAERFDPEQVGGCKRRWYFQSVMRLEVPEPEESKNDGHAGHALFAMHYRGEVLPKRHRMLKAVRGALEAGHLPLREPGQLIESRFDGQPARDANGERVPLRTSATLWLGGVSWDGYVDLRFERRGVVTVLDHKFSSDIHAYAKSDLLATVQMPVYALDSLRIWPDAQQVELIHSYVSRRGVDSFLRRQVVTAKQIRARGREIEGLVAEMIAVSKAPTAEDVPGNRKSCHTWSGCPFQSRCSTFKERPKMELSEEEMSWLNVVGGGETEAPTKLGELKEVPPPTDAPLSPPEVEEMRLADEARVRVDADEDPFAVFAPQPSVPQEQPAPAPSCPDCATELNAQNGSQRDGKWIHIGCPAGVKIGSSAAPNVTVVRGSGDAGPTMISAKCPDCPHPAHPGAACTGKRGRGACRCGAQGAMEKAQDAAALAGGHLPTCVQNDAGKWLCMEGCTASIGGGAGVTLTVANPGKASDVLNAPEMMVEVAPGVLEPLSGVAAREVEDARVSASAAAPPALPSGWSGTLRVEVNLGPETLALLTRILGR